jgi:hypothetical protein
MQTQRPTLLLPKARANNLSQPQAKGSQAQARLDMDPQSWMIRLIHRRLDVGLHHNKGGTRSLYQIKNAGIVPYLPTRASDRLN